MKTITLFLLIASSISGMAIDLFRPASSFVPSNTNVWSYSIGQDNKNGAWFYQPGLTTNRIHMTINMGTTIAPGWYAVSINSIDYDRYWKTQFEGGDGLVTSDTTDRDANTRWSVFAKFQSSIAFSNIVVTWTNDLHAANKTALLGIALTSKTNAVMLNTGNYQEFVYPSTNDWDETQSGENKIKNGSFEAGIQGVGLFSNSRTRGLQESLTDTEAWDGRFSLQLVVTNGEVLQLITKPITVPRNRIFVGSVRIKSTASNTVTVRWTNTFSFTNLAGFGLPNTVGAMTVGTSSSNWLRFAATNRALNYPVPDYNVMFQIQGGTGTGRSTNWIDGMMFADSTTTNYTAASPIELSMWTTNDAHIYYPDESPSIPVMIHNSSTGSLSGTIKVRSWDYLNREVMSSSQDYTLASRGTNTLLFSFPSGQRGHFRVEAYDTAYGGIDESNISIVERPRAVQLEQSKFGWHTIDAPFIYRMMNRLGVKWARRMSPGAYFRWAEAEKTQGVFTWYDSAIDGANSNNVTTLGNIMQNTPPFGGRTFFRLTGPAGDFTEGETVKTINATGIVSQVMASTNFTGRALYISNTIGSFSNSTVVTGSVSLASGTVTTINGAPVAQTDVPDLRLWRLYVSNLVTHYQGKVRHWEMCNEPNQGSQYTVGDAGVYSEMLRYSVPMIRSIQTNSVITALGGALTTNWIGTVLSNMSSIGLVSSFSNASVHIYPGNDGTGPSINEIMVAYGLPWMNTESGSVDHGALVGEAASGRREGTPVERFYEAERYYNGTGHMAMLTTKNHIESLGDGAIRIFTYDHRAYAPDHFDQEFTGLEYDDTLKPISVALANAAWHIDGKSTLGRGHASTNVISYVWNGGTNTVISAHSKSETNNYTVTLPVGFPGFVRRDFYGNAVGTNEASFQVTGYDTYLTLTNAAASVLTNFAESTITLQTDSEGPIPVITVAPRSPAPIDSQTIPLRWFSVDKRIKPYTGALAEAITYRTRLHPVELDYGEWTAQTALDMVGYPAGQYTLNLQTRDIGGGTNSVAETFWLGPVVPSGPSAIFPSATVYNLFK